MGDRRRSRPTKKTSKPPKPLTETAYLQSAKGLRIVPGQWRPHFPYEQIAWISPAWPSQHYLWLDFPEAIFSDRGLLFLSHEYPGHPVNYPGLPKVPWETIDGGISFRRVLPDGLVFGGSITSAGEQITSLTLFLENGTDEPLGNLTLQTCLCLKAAAEFSGFDTKRKFVHIPEFGWLPIKDAQKCGAKERDGFFRVGWRSGPAIADLPVMATVSQAATDRQVAFTWYSDTYSLIGNTRSPCMHADPFFPDLGPGERGVIHGEIIFFEGPLQSFGNWFADRWSSRRKNPGLE